MARVFIKADKDGQILAVRRVEVLPKGRKTPFDDDEEPRGEVIEVSDAPGKTTFSEMDVGEIHMGYVVDLKKKALKRKKKEPGT